MPSSFYASAAILGIGIAIESNVSEALEAALDIFPDAAAPGTVAAPSLSLILDADHDTHSPTSEHRICGKQLCLADNGIRLLADGERGHANCSFRIDVIRTELFRETVRTAALFLATHQGRIPVHASAVMIGDCAVVLAGRSGAGKSTLALAGARAGLPVLAEDTVFVQRDPAFRVWGLADHIHVFEKDAPPGSDARTRWRSGRLKLALPIARTRQSSDKAALCAIVRGDHIAFEPLPPGNAVQMLCREQETGYDLFADHMEEALRAVAAGGCWQLTLSHEPDDAIAALLEAHGTGARQQFG
jgi:hypothetical protein